MVVLVYAPAQFTTVDRHTVSLNYHFEALSSSFTDSIPFSLLEIPCGVSRQKVRGYSKESSKACVPPAPAVTSAHSVKHVSGTEALCDAAKCLALYQYYLYHFYGHPCHENGTVSLGRRLIWEFGGLVRL